MMQLKKRFRDYVSGTVKRFELYDKAVISFVDFVMKQVDCKIFEDYIKKFPETKDLFQERFYPKKIIRIDVYKDLNRDILIKIYKHLLFEDDFQLDKEVL